MLEFDDDIPVPLSAADLTHITRENGRSLSHYKDILSQYSLPQIEAKAGDQVLEIGCGQANATLDLLSMVSPGGKVVALDIDENSILSGSHRIRHEHPRLNVGVETEGVFPSESYDDKDVLFISADASGPLLSLPNNCFETAISVWVLYQVLGKVEACLNVIRSLKVGGTFTATCTGSIAVSKNALSPEDKEFLSERIWNSRYSRFAWLTGVRELAYWASHRKIQLHVVSLPQLLEIMLGDSVSIVHGNTPSARPEGAMLLKKNVSPLRTRFQLSLPDPPAFVATRYSALIPIYESSALFDAITAASPHRTR